MTEPQTLLGLITASRKERTVEVVPISPRESKEWTYDRDRVAHRTGRFFSIIGVELVSEGRVLRQPYIAQPEIGTLAFLLRATPQRIEALVQLKAEPGNVGGVQVAPTCQATRSNLDRAHGGTAPPGHELDGPADHRWTVIADSLQSEQGSRFFQKRNRNCTMLAHASDTVGILPAEESQWVDTRQLLPLLRRDYLVNTDARSVLVTTPWQSLSGDEPFAGRSDETAQLLRLGYERQSAEAAHEAADGVLGWLAQRRDRCMADAPRVVAIGEVPGLRVEALGTSYEEAEFDIRHVAVRIGGRERDAWDQPLIESRTPGRLTLVGAYEGGLLRFIFRATYEAGLTSLVELQPTVVQRPGEARVASPQDQRFAGIEVASVWQSEEGGRFLHDRNEHVLLLMPGPMPELRSDEVALTLREIEQLARVGAFTNEARTTISVLLSFR